MGNLLAPDWDFFWHSRLALLNTLLYVLTGGTADVKQTPEEITISVPPGDRKAIDTVERGMRHASSTQSWGDA